MSKSKIVTLTIEVEASELKKLIDDGEKQGKGLDRKELEKMIYSIAHGCFLEPGSKTMRELSQAIINRFGKRELDKEKIKDIICKTSNASYKTLGYIVDEDRLAQTLVNGDVWK